MRAWVCALFLQTNEFARGTNLGPCAAPAPPLLVGHFKYLQVKLFHCLLHNCSRHTHSMCVCMCVGLGAWVVGEVPASCPEIHLSDALSPRRTEACCLLIKFKFDLLLVSYWISILFSCPFSLSRWLSLVLLCRRHSGWASIMPMAEQKRKKKHECHAEGNTWILRAWKVQK